MTMSPKFSKLLRRVSKILKFKLQNKFIQKGDKEGLNYALLAVASLRSKRAPFPFNYPLSALQYKTKPE